MKSIRRGLWDGEVGKDARGRFSCRICRESLTPSESAVAGEPSVSSESAVSGDSPDAADAVDAGESPETDGEIRSCPECGRAWRATAPRWRTTGG
ncbi:hypothetical protein [Halorussus salinus]|uniref:hypothetical protein n=1 Tax=Halorussus salinus TaxID=1364935 RepID=UPI0010926224|nr:hypothetical protein [Halorussus salinus]